jgi:hypothetical protein
MAEPSQACLCIAACLKAVDGVVVSSTLGRLPFVDLTPAAFGGFVELAPVNTFQPFE